MTSTRRYLSSVCLLALPFVAHASAQPPTLDLEWVRVGDSEGAINQERGIASIEAAEFSPDGTLIASGAKRGGDVRVWTTDGTELWRRFHQNDPSDEVEVVAWTKDGAYVLSAGEDFRVRVWEATTGTAVRTLDHIASIDGMRFSNAGHLLATGDEAGQISIWDTSEPDPRNWPAVPLYKLRQGPDQDRPGGGTGHSDVNSLDWTGDDRFLFSAGRNAEVRQWETARFGQSDQGLTNVYRGFLSSIKSVRLSPDEQLVAAGGQDSPEGLVLVWDVASGNIVERIDYTTNRKIEAVEWTPDGRYLITGGVEGRNNEPPYPGNNGIGPIRFYDRDDAFALVLEQDTFRQEYFDFDPTGSRLISSHEDGTLRLWNVGTSGGGASGPPIGQTIALRAEINTRYVAVDLNRSAKLIADRAQIGPWEKFEVTDGGDSVPQTVAFVANANGRFVTADEGVDLAARGQTVGPSNRFVWQENDDGTICLRSPSVNNSYVVAENRGLDPLRANRPACLSWERFTWTATGN